jgi:hypothetical protein
MGKPLLAIIVFAIPTLPISGRGDVVPAPASQQYVFVQHLDRIVAVRRGFWVSYGQLNADGELIADGKHHAGRREANLPYRLIANELTYEQPKACYELHSGRLIKGAMTKAGSFVPEEGSTVIRFEDYHYAPDALPIWNLPGYFTRRDEFDARRKWLAANAHYLTEYANEKARLDAAAEHLK